MNWETLQKIDKSHGEDEEFVPPTHEKGHPAGIPWKEQAPQTDEVTAVEKVGDLRSITPLLGK